MRVVVKDESGRQVTWRVGRRRLAWRPRYHRWFIDDADDFDLLFVLNVIPLAAYLVSWTGALLATTLVWPWRAVTGKWPVVAYPTTTEGKGCRAHVRGGRAADALAHRWRTNIVQSSQPQTSSTRLNSVPTG